MNQEDIIRMAGEAGMAPLQEAPWLSEFLVRFATLVVANIDPKSSMSWQDGYEAGVVAEREAFAKVADKWPDYDVQGLAEKIRARGKP